MGYLFIKGYIYILLIYLCLVGYWVIGGFCFCGYMVGIIFVLGFFLGFLEGMGLGVLGFCGRELYISI